MSVQAFGSFVKTPTDNGINQSATNSGGVLANYRFFFSPSNGIEVNYGYSLNTQTYGLESGPLGVKSDQHEVSAAYVFRHKMHGFTPFAEAGASALAVSYTHLDVYKRQGQGILLGGGERTYPRPP